MNAHCSFSTAFEQVKRFTKENVRGARSDLLTIAGILLVIGSCVSLASGLFSVHHFASVIWFSETGISVAVVVDDLLSSVFALHGLVYGLVAGVQSLRRKQLLLCVVGAIILMIVGILNIVALFYRNGEGLSRVIFFGIPSIVLAFTGLVTLTMRRKEFA